MDWVWVGSAAFEWMLSHRVCCAGQTGHTPLLVACESGHIVLAKWLANVKGAALLTDRTLVRKTGAPITKL